jgi:hypothetical protein
MCGKAMQSAPSFPQITKQHARLVIRSYKCKTRLQTADLTVAVCNMSPLIFLRCFENQKPAGIPRDTVRKAFGSFLKEPEPDFWNLPRGAGKSWTLFLEPFDAGSVHQITVKRSFQDPRLWVSLAVVLRRAKAILYSPQRLTPLIADEGVIQHIPPGLLRALGPPVVIRHGQEIRAVMDPSRVSCEINTFA